MIAIRTTAALTHENGVTNPYHFSPLPLTKINGVEEVQEYLRYLS